MIAPALKTHQLVAIAVLASATPVLAQAATSLDPAQQATADGTLDELVVTGLSRKQSAQDAPVSVTVFTQAAIEDARIQDMYDLVALSPNLSISQSQGAAINLLTIRGISQVQSGQSPVAVVVDGVQEMDPRQFAQDLYNIAQIEVLRGPQGDLWGRNAIGGAIIINTPEPSNNTDIGAHLQVGNGGTYKAQTSASGSLVTDKLFYSVNVSENQFGGLLKNIYLDKTADRSNDLSGRGQLKAVLTDDLTADLRVGLDGLRGGANLFHYQPTNYNPSAPCFLNAANPFSALPGDANRVDRTFCSNNRGEETRDIRDASLKLVYERPFASITNVLAWSEITDYLASDQFPYTASTSTHGVDGTQSQWSRQSSREDEFRITSPSSDRFRWMVGGYYLNVTDYISRPIGLDRGLGIVKITNTPAFNNPINPTVSYLGNADHNHDYAVFGHLAFDITKSLTAELGYRYDWNALNQYVDPASTSGVPPGCASLYSEACRRNRAFNQGQPKAALTYKVNSDLTFFTDYGIGFRSGQFNQSGTAAVAGLPGVRDVVNAEKADTFEAGFKSEWLDRRLRIDGTFYYTSDMNPSYLLFVGSIGAQILVNIDKVRNIGGDLDINYTILPGLSVYANGGYTDSTIEQYTIDPTLRGKHAPLVPDLNANVGVQYRHAITEAIIGFGRFGVETHGTEYWDVQNSTARHAFSLYNAQIGLEPASIGWSLVFYVNNLTDKAYNTNYVAGGFSIPAEPRTFGADIRFRF